MKYWDPVPDNPCPPGMAIRVDTPHHLTLLLFIRDAWHIAGDADVPRLEPLPEAGISQLPDSATPAEWEARWHRAWARLWDWYSVEEPDPTVHPSPARLRSVWQPGHGLDPLVPPFWQADYGWDGIDTGAYNAWVMVSRPHADTHPGRNAAELPEPQSLPALIAAWENGLDTVIVLPCQGYFARRITARHLAVSAATRNEPAAYSRALRTAAGDR
ncbi:hypothetical protein NicSoilB4_30510 [Arthrobacter sp. NicSoilB4]|uniref:hypothetical protein n=1 Tax=Arthrobacter sp. NicSoilB4 TaxID=2830997 RepID=UPI001CC5C10A|nr:hypothetical protein [Arthrobacter sp. NicSoilB4]BCW68288.1 hypothetical protein NicSoilB4_30510 [Arthrobacter sp. NicSoilB4]